MAKFYHVFINPSILSVYGKNSALISLPLPIPPTLFVLNLLPPYYLCGAQIFDAIQTLPLEIGRIIPEILNLLDASREEEWYENDRENLLRVIFCQDIRHDGKLLEKSSNECQFFLTLLNKEFKKEEEFRKLLEDKERTVGLSVHPSVPHLFSRFSHRRSIHSGMKEKKIAANHFPWSVPSSMEAKMEEKEKDTSLKEVIYQPERNVKWNPNLTIKYVNILGENLYSLLQQIKTHLSHPLLSVSGINHLWEEISLLPYRCICMEPVQG
jgi:hypothetical protein